MMERYTCYIVNHTHWDREWYFPFEVFRHRFSLVIDRVVNGLEQGNFDCFVLDGQMAAIEDFFEIAEDGMKERVLKLIKSQKLIIGPWYVLADEFLVHGESLIRNMQIGLKMAREYGKPQMLGYLPDTFGHVSQMPQLLNGFGINNAMLWRGIKPEKSEFNWLAPDGSKVLTLFLPEGYYQPLLNEENVEECLKTYLEKVKPYATTPNVILTNGGDHLMPKHERINVKDIKPIDHVNFIESDFESYVQKIKSSLPSEIGEYIGEMRNNEHIYVLPNVLSTRSYLKKQNQELEDELLGYTEPLFALMAGGTPERYIQETWKLLIKNHPHDSICGCSVDEVHQEMENRTMMLRQRVDMLQKQALANVNSYDFSMSGNSNHKPFDSDQEFTVFNPHPVNYKGWVKGTIWLSEEYEDFLLEDKKAQIYQPTILDKRVGRLFASPLDAFPDFKSGWYYDVAFYVDHLSALSLTSFQVNQGDGQRLVEDQGWEIVNESVQIRLEQNGTLTVTDTKGVTYNNVLELYSSLDAGDEYNYSPPLKDQLYRAKLVSKPIVHKSNTVERITYHLEIEQAAELNEERTGPSKEVVITTVDVILQLFKNDPLIYSKVTIDNKAKDQRLRLKLPLQTRIDHTYSDSAFDIVKRDAQKIEEFHAPKQKEVSVVVEPSLSLVRADHIDKGFYFFHRGLQEYQVTKNHEMDVLEVTLVRSVGWLSRDDFTTRGGGAGPNLATPEGQCLRKVTFDFAFSPAKREIENSEIASLAHQFRIPPRLYSGKTDDSTNRILEIDNPNVQWSMIREQDGVLEVRLWNPNDKPEEITFSSIYQIDFVEKVNFDGNKQGICEQLDTLGPKKIQTYRIQMVR